MEKHSPTMGERAVIHSPKPSNEEVHCWVTKRLPIVFRNRFGIAFSQKNYL